jgi:site-specific DNA-methyltransferase (adenine-specific)
MDSDKWETPEWLYDKLDREFGFDADLCADYFNNKATRWFEDYLHEELYVDYRDCPEAVARNEHWDWSDFNAAFINPPYSNPLPFIEKAYEDSKVCKIVALIKCDPSTKTWDVFWDYKNHCPKPGVEVRFLPKRLRFEYQGKPGKHAAAFPSAIIIMDRRYL